MSIGRQYKSDSLPLWKWILELILGVILFTVLYGIGIGFWGIPQPVAKDVAVLIVAVFILAIFRRWTRLFEKQWKWELLARNEGKNILCGVLIGFSFFVLLTGLLYVAGCYSIQYVSPHWSDIISNLCLFFLVACCEEVIFRGVIFRLIDDRFGLWWALGISALIFGFAHMFNPGASIWSSVAIVMEAGILLGAAYKYSNSLWLPIGIHWAWNFTQGNVFGFAVSGEDAGESIFTANIDGPDIITGGSFGPEASGIALLLGTIISAFFLWKILNSTSFLPAHDNDL